eukprot:338207_1
MINQHHVLLWLLFISYVYSQTNVNKFKSSQSMNRILLSSSKGGSSSDGGVDCSQCPDIITNQDCSQCQITTQDCCSQCTFTTQDCSQCPITTQDCSKCPFTTQDCSECHVTTQNCPDSEFTFPDCSGLPCTNLSFEKTNDKICNTPRDRAEVTLETKKTRKYCAQGGGSNMPRKLTIQSIYPDSDGSLLSGMILGFENSVFYLETSASYNVHGSFGDREICITNKGEKDHPIRFECSI